MREIHPCPRAAASLASFKLPRGITMSQAAVERPVTQTRSSMAGIKSDRWIRQMALEHDMINPFSEKQVREGVISYGLSSYGYDLRVADEFKIFTNVMSAVVDPKHFDERSFVTVNSDVAMVPPNS